jgi:hypothetical protein
VDSTGTVDGAELATRRLICVIAAAGCAFDTYELLMLPLVAGPALQELLGLGPGSPGYQQWVGRLFYVPALVVGGVWVVGGGTRRIGWGAGGC